MITFLHFYIFTVCNAFFLHICLLFPSFYICISKKYAFRAVCVAPLLLRKQVVMSQPTAQQTLDAINKAIHDIANGQASEKYVTTPDGRVQKFLALNLQSLYKLKSQYQTEVTAASSGSNSCFSGAVFTSKGRFS